MSDRGGMPKEYAFLLREERQNTTRGTQPFLVRFASAVFRDGRPRPSRETGHTLVDRETTDDR